MTRYEQGFIKAAESRGLNRVQAVNLLKIAVSPPKTREEMIARRKRIKKILLPIIFGLSGGVLGGAVNWIYKGDARERKYHRDSFGKWVDSAGNGNSDIFTLPKGTYRASDAIKGGLVGALAGGALGYGSAELGNYLSDYTGVDPMLTTIRTEK